jgi:hypothetical protein
MKRRVGYRLEGIGSGLDFFDQGLFAIVQILEFGIARESSVETSEGIRLFLRERE